ncbi:unnamed protein product [Psylliodes chrysocephalus]|uniref:UDP-glucuronosyltransferase n=1 Tax=Psylliodes chrysocephalus TaxID=3402493 RepID=A0A9P0GDN2_9CUCU|nr:unnamed protein product [Psylliodes chrysocephala]
MLCKSVVFCFSLTLLGVSASKILAIVPSPSYSHQISFRKIWIELSLKGHEVTLITPDPMNDPKLTNLKEINVNGTYNLMNDVYQNIHNVSRFQLMKIMTNTFEKIFEYQLSTDSVKKLMSNESHFDLVISESFLFEYQAFSDLYKCPKILVSSMDPLSFVHSVLGNPPNHVANPDILLPYISENMNFFGRLHSFVHNILYKVFKWYIHFPQRHEVLKRHFGETVRHPAEILLDTDLLLINSHPIFAGIRTVGPNVIYFGGGNHIFPLKPLPKDLQDFLNDAKDGCIYFSLGSNSKSVDIPEDKIQIIMETLSELPYKVLWKFEMTDVIKPPKNVKFISWAPQQDILRHPNIKLFITQGGVQSLEESVISHVPMVILPIHGDQESNAMRMELTGVARIVPYKPNLNKEQFKSIILEVISDPKYKENCIKTADILLDQPMKGVDKAIWWIEYVIRHNGAKHFRSPVLDIPAYQYYGLDVMGAIFLFFYIIFKIPFWILRICRKSKAVSKVESKKKKQ